MKSIYLIGSLRNPAIPPLGNRLRTAGYDVYDSWFAAGKIADDSWQEYSNIRGLSLREALQDYSAQQVFNFDKRHLDRCDGAVLALPAGKSGHIELGYMAKDKPTWVLFNEVPERYDVMYNFATDVCITEDELLEAIKKQWQ